MKQGAPLVRARPTVSNLQTSAIRPAPPEVFSSEGIAERSVTNSPCYSAVFNTRTCIDIATNRPGGKICRSLLPS